VSVVNAVLESFPDPIIMCSSSPVVVGAFGYQRMQSTLQAVACRAGGGWQDVPRRFGRCWRWSSCRVIPQLQFVGVAVWLWWLGFALAVTVVHPDSSAGRTNIPPDDKVG
jgi:hypothetical protein